VLVRLVLAGTVSERCSMQVSSQGYQLQAVTEGRDISNWPWQCEYEAGHVGPHSWQWEAITNDITDMWPAP
jgi:hypothetical protein